MDRHGDDKEEEVDPLCSEVAVVDLDSDSVYRHGFLADRLAYGAGLVDLACCPFRARLSFLPPGLLCARHVLPLVVASIGLEGVVLHHQ